jgi:hypothetical protein
MNISQAITNQFKDKILIADVECYNSITCLTEHLKDTKIKVLRVKMFETGEATLYANIVEGEFSDKECSFHFNIETEFNFID